MRSGTVGGLGREMRLPRSGMCVLRQTMTAPASSPAWPRARICPSCPMSYSRRPTSCTCSGAWRGSVLSAWKPFRSNLPASSDRHGRDATDAGHALARVPEPQIPAAPRRQHRVQVSNAQVLDEGFSSFGAVCRDRHADAAQTCSSTVGTRRSLAGPTVSRARSARNHGPARRSSDLSRLLSARARVRARRRAGDGSPGGLEREV